MGKIDQRFEEHRSEALRLLAAALHADESMSSAVQRNMIAASQVHAALAQAVAQDSAQWANGDSPGR